MTAAGRVALGFLIGGVAMLLAHPSSRPVMSYAFQPNRAKEVLETNLLYSEPLEFFPPDAVEMDGRARFLTAFRVVRRLNSKWVKADEGDLRTLRRFIENCEASDPENAYWPQLMAAVYGYQGDLENGANEWQKAVGNNRWETGAADTLRLLWEDLAKADGLRLAWQGIVALEHASEGPSEFIVENVQDFAYLDTKSRFASLMNAAVILDSARSFSTASTAIALAHVAVFRRANPIDALGQRRYEELKTAFPRKVSQEINEQTAQDAVLALQTVESWQSFYRDGAPMAKATLNRVRIESLLSASLPSSTLMASLVLLAIGLVGTLTAYLLGPVLNPDRLVILCVGVVVAVFLWWKTGVFLLGLWVLTIATVLGIPQMIARDEPIDWRRAERATVAAVSVLGLILLTAFFIQESAPAELLGGGKTGGSLYGAVGGLTLSLALPCAAVWARLRRVSVMRAAGETLRLVGFSGAIVGLAATIALSPLALWRDAANRTLVEEWIRSEPATFRPDAPL